jgi:hypothetical protein
MKELRSHQRKSPFWKVNRPLKLDAQDRCAGGRKVWVEKSWLWLLEEATTSQ